VGGLNQERGCQQYKGVFEGLNGPSVCSVQRLGTVHYFATWFQRSSRDGSARYVVIDTKWIYCCNIRRVINCIVRTSNCGEKWETNNQVAFNGIGLVIGGVYFSCVILSEHFSSGALSSNFLC